MATVSLVDGDGKPLRTVYVSPREVDYYVEKFTTLRHYLSEALSDDEMAAELAEFDDLFSDSYRPPR